VPERDPKFAKAARALHKRGFGKLLPEAFYIHKRYFKELPKLFQHQVARAKEIAKGKLGSYNILRVGLKGDTVGFSWYPTFDSEPTPELARSVWVDVRARKVKITDYSDRPSPPVLHRKELFVAPGYPGYKKFKRLTESQEAAGLLNISGIGTKRAWEELLRKKGLTIRGGAVAKRNPKQTAPKLKKASSRAKATEHKVSTTRRNPKDVTEFVASQDAMRSRENGFSIAEPFKSNGSWVVAFTAWKKKAGGQAGKAEVYTTFTHRTTGLNVRITEFYGTGGESLVWKGTFTNPEQAVGITSAKISKRRGYYPTKRAAQGKRSKSRRPRVLSWLANPGKAEQKMEPVTRVFRLEQTKAKKVYPELGYVKLQVDPDIHDSERSFAQVTYDDGQLAIQVAPELADEPLKVIRGVIRHEFGHALREIRPRKKALRSYDAIERDADRLAEQLFGARIFYNKRGVEVSGPGAQGVRPRPRGLR